ncbi:MAG: transporter substrate-binding domain-containing protein, partial [Okeania sp. SIO3B3]|nr:transporter substrate-binding domain-containing protein [Okeania sp. SIO3B3]
PEEAAFLEEHPVIRASSVNDFPPFDFRRSGEPVGFSIDYLNLLARKIGVRVSFAPVASSIMLISRTHIPHFNL